MRVSFGRLITVTSSCVDLVRTPELPEVTRMFVCELHTGKIVWFCTWQLLFICRLALRRPSACISYESHWDASSSSSHVVSSQNNVLCRAWGNQYFSKAKMKEMSFKGNKYPFLATNKPSDEAGIRKIDNVCELLHWWNLNNVLTSA